MASEWEIESCVCGYNIYQSVWTPTLDDELICVRDPFNSIVKFVVTVKNDDTAVGHSRAWALAKKDIKTLFSILIERLALLHTGCLARS